MRSMHVMKVASQMVASWELPQHSDNRHCEMLGNDRQHREGSKLQNIKKSYSTQHTGRCLQKFLAKRTNTRTMKKPSMKENIGS